MVRIDAGSRGKVGGSWGKSRRLGRLCTPGGRYLWLALDHGLTHGQLDGLTDIPRLRSLVRAPELSAVVVNRGLAVALAPDTPAGLVLQAFGRPAMAREDSAKVPTCRVEDAIRLGADAVSVQLDLGGPALSHAVHAVSLMISDAASYDIPVLIMVTPKPGPEMLASIADALRVCTELGGDLIKIGLPADVLDADPEQLAALQTAVVGSPPVLLAGGPRGDGLAERVALAREVGFSGACIGRSVFQDPEPEAVLAALAAALDDRPLGGGK